MATDVNNAVNSSKAPNKSPWNWQPQQTVEHNPLFSWPLEFRRIASWYAKGWQPTSEYGLFILLALLSWFFLQAPLSESGRFATAWIAPIYLRNLAYMLVIAGGLHLYFYTFRKQGSVQKYQARGLQTGKSFTFNDQVRDNMFWSLVSGVTLWTAYEALLIHALANGHAPLYLWHQGTFWFIALFFIIPIWISLHFYCVHRLLHWPRLYKLAHSVHHRNQTTGPWSGISMHPLEHLIYFSSVLIHFAVPSHPLHVFFHMYALTISAVFGHTGFDSLLIRGKPRLAIGHFHHQLHHRYFEVNYGASELPCDEWFNTFDDGTPQARQRLKHRN